MCGTFFNRTWTHISHAENWSDQFKNNESIILILFSRKESNCLTKNAK